VNTTSKYREVSVHAKPGTFGLILLAAASLLLAGWDSTSARPAFPAQAGSTNQSKLVWSDEFDAPNGSAPDPRKWTYDLGGKGWGNQELETYTDRPLNAFIQNGMLVIEARKETFTGKDGVARDYTSARLKTQGLFSQTFGRIEARIKIPYGQGLWPALWMLGDDVDKAGWPNCGEIDIMENIGREPSMVHGTIHGPEYSGGKGVTAAYSLPIGRRFADDFHIYAVEWRPHRIQFFVDGNLYTTILPTSLPPGARWVYDHPFFIILNVAVGGSWPGNPDGTTPFPQTMQVDYVRAYKRAP
jgi:beta-glucanase (GH16 family)